MEGHQHHATLPTHVAQSMLPVMGEQKFEAAAFKAFCLETIIRTGKEADICFKPEAGELQRNRFKL